MKKKWTKLDKQFWFGVVIAFIILILLIYFVTIPLWKPILYPEKLPKKTLEEKYFELQQEIREKEFELFQMKRLFVIYTMDMDAMMNNLTVEYKKIPNSSLVMRMEYNGSVFENITFVGDLIEVKISKTIP